VPPQVRIADLDRDRTLVTVADGRRVHRGQRQAASAGQQPVGIGQRAAAGPGRRVSHPEPANPPRWQRVDPLGAETGLGQADRVDQQADPRPVDGRPQVPGGSQPVPADQPERESEAGVGQQVSEPANPLGQHAGAGRGALAAALVDEQGGALAAGRPAQRGQAGQRGQPGFKHVSGYRDVAGRAQAAGELDRGDREPAEQGGHAVRAAFGGDGRDPGNRRLDQREPASGGGRQVGGQVHVEPDTGRIKAWPHRHPRSWSER
jgi:hypothetical protein